MIDSSTGKDKIHINIEPALRKAVHHLAVDRDRTLNDEVIEALRYWVSIKGKASGGSKSIGSGERARGQNPHGKSDEPNEGRPEAW